MKQILCLLVCLMGFDLSAQTKIKVGVLVPEGTSWATNLKSMSKEIALKTQDRVKFKMYFGGSLGDEVDVLRKIRIGQIQGGLFTGKTLGDIDGDIRVMEIPFTFLHDRQKAWTVLQSLKDNFNLKIRKNGFHNLGYFEIGLIYFVSQIKVESIDGLSGVKIWSWDGDPLVKTMLDSMKLISVPLGLPDVLSSLSTGILEAAYASPMAIVALQWSGKVKYLVDFPISYSVGAFLVEQKTWNQLSQHDQNVVEEISTTHLNLMNEATIKENNDALEVMKSSGIEFVKFSESDIKRGFQIREDIINKLQGHLIQKDMIDKLQKSL